MTENQLVYLIVRHLSGGLTEEENGKLTEWAEMSPDNQLLLDHITDEEQLEKELNLWRSLNAAAGHAKWLHHMQARRKAIIRRVTGWSVAASLLIAVAVIVLNRKSDQADHLSTVVPVVTAQHVLPGRNTARLTLSNGQEILLDSAGNGNLVKQGNSQLIKPDSGRLSYVVSGIDNREPVVYNTLTTPRSGQYQLALPDGSRVWLNNISSLRYPTSFRGKNRMVELTGEAYFEIAKNTSMPFLVKVNNQMVQVIGTSFNIMAYPEEGNIQTTLLTGAVIVKAGNTSVQLGPDEQARANKDGVLKVLKEVPSQDIVSWKDGFFYFGRASFEAVMRQLARWYNVNVIYQGKAPDMEFGGKIDRSLPLDQLLKFLDKNQVRFRLEGNNLVVLSS